MVLTKLYNQKVRQEMFNGIMADVRSNSACIVPDSTEKYIGIEMLTDILTVKLLREKPEGVNNAG